MSWLIYILVNSLVLIVVAGYFDSFHLDGISSAIIASLVLAVINIIVKPFLILITLPITFLTLGLFLFIINAITLMITESIMGSAFEIDSFGMAFLASIIISLLQTMIHKTIIEPLRKKRSLV